MKKISRTGSKKETKYAQISEIQRAVFYVVERRRAESRPWDHQGLSKLVGTITRSRPRPALNSALPYATLIIKPAIILPQRLKDLLAVICRFHDFRSRHKHHVFEPARGSRSLHSLSSQLSIRAYFASDIRQTTETQLYRQKYKSAYGGRMGAL